MDCFERAYLYLVRKTLEKAGVTADITITKRENANELAGSDADCNRRVHSDGLAL